MPKVKATSSQVRELKLPRSQKIITLTCSSATYLMKLIPADRIVATMIPDRMRLLEAIRPSKEEMERTKSRVSRAPTKAKSGTA